jgi:hypothetical protein
MSDIQPLSLPSTSRTKPEPYRANISDVIGDMQIPEVGGRMVRKLIELPDHSLLWCRISRRRGLRSSDG